MNQVAGPKWIRWSVVDVSGDESKIWCCKEQCCIGTWNIRPMNQGKLGMVKQEMVRININILEIRKLKWMGMGEFNPRLHHFADQELPDVQERFRKGRGTRDQIVNICWITEKAKEFQKNIYFCFIDYSKSFTALIMTNCGKLLEVWEYQTILPVSWETRMWVKKQQLEPCIEQLVQDGFKIEKGVRQGSLLSLFCSV